MKSQIKIITSANRLSLQNDVNEFLDEYEEQYVKITTIEVDKKPFHTAVIKYKVPENEYGNEYGNDYGIEFNETL